MDSIYKKNNVVSIWLGVMLMLVLLMVVIGGATRLTDSGLSMTEWKPVTGILPPLSEDQWYIEFGKYKKSPEYLKINEGMELSEFKSIYWLEYIHRVAGRVTGVVFVIPLLIFFLVGKIERKEISYYLFISLLFAGQGLMGWYMVKSGLIDNPHVSHFRLAFHLLLAVFIYSLLFWKKMKYSFERMLVPSSDKLSNVKKLFTLTLIITVCQIFVGGLVAGLNAGLIYNSFPLMGDSIIPEEFYNIEISFTSIFNNPVSVQFIHRCLGMLVLLMAMVTFYHTAKTGYPKLKNSGKFLLSAALLQVILGICTLIFAVPIILALLHQLAAIMLVASLLWGLFLIKNS